MKRRIQKESIQNTTTKTTCIKNRPDVNRISHLKSSDSFLYFNSKHHLQGKENKITRSKKSHHTSRGKRLIAIEHSSEKAIRAI
mmetsp:Transcript_26973/g.23814  ORF Transcript_26973/g.23814 Transcript_26973/m.23814 type:complete len:84 (-) Transcript_26973:16-267(-)